MTAGKAHGIQDAVSEEPPNDKIRHESKVLAEATSPYLSQLVKAALNHTGQ